MQRLRPVDGTELHRRATRYHMSKCRNGKAPLHQELYTEVTAVYKLLVGKSREVEDAEDTLMDTLADVDDAEIALENLIRDIHADLGRLDRIDPSLCTQATIFPRGFGQLIDPEGEEQLDVLPSLRVSLAQFQSHTSVAEALVTLDGAEASLRTALKASQKADDTVTRLFEAEREARRAVREQLESANGRLRAFYKAKPALAETFFLRPGTRKPSRKPRK